MPFKKLHSHLLETFERLSIDTPTPFQKSSIPVVKSGANVFCIAPKDSGKTTTLILTTLQKLKCEAVGNAPRAIVIVENKDKALALYDAFFEYTKYSSVRIYASYEQLHIDVQKSEIYMGIDILITTPKTLHKLFLSNGVSISELKICSIDDAEFLSVKSDTTSLIVTAASIKKCQFVVYAEKMHPQLKRLENHFMEYSKLIQK
ncbi:DEAD/DEAH box helicase [Aurantibacter crassamenti]|uniref:DEAD/DEAH box helicase n=1 Tax=Aurantibacter crassamenti TaxID=1837375 RepID=UPI00193A115C|nr:DEAD/DEAH box helicase [Aurantibacter crassamenti]MBM1107152.1 DEAD/DEAH box helicase [Aurantibacter crassamenti]